MDLKLIAKALAASEPKTRSEGFYRMRSYLTSLTAPEQLPHVWKSLFYYLWMADKLHLETIQELESLYSVTQFDSFLWFSSFLDMMRNEWEGLDPVRIDKYMLLVRYMLRTILISAIKDTKTWVGLLSDFIEKSVYKAQSLLFHIADIYLEELPECEFRIKVKMIAPFLKLMKTTRINHLAEMVYNKILLKLVEEKDERLGKWLFKRATSEESMQSKARDKFYDAYAIATGEPLPKRDELGANEGTKKRRKQKKKSLNSQVSSEEQATEIIPEALQKVMKEFYNPINEILDTKNTLETLHIGKDVIELKHEELVGKKKKKKKKKPEDVFDELCKDFSARTGKSLEGGEPSAKVSKSKNSRKVNFNLKMNLTKVFDNKNVVSSGTTDKPKKAGKGILKPRSFSSGKPIKKQKTK